MLFVEIESVDSGCNSDVLLAGGFRTAMDSPAAQPGEERRERKTSQQGKERVITDADSEGKATAKVLLVFS
jgi:hypothetical protein